MSFKTLNETNTGTLWGKVKSYVNTRLAALGSVATEDVVPINKGGHGGVTAKEARTNLGITYGASAPTTAPSTGDGSIYFFEDNYAPMAIEEGGTGANTAAGARQNINIIGYNPITSVEEDTPANWKALGTGYCYISGTGKLNDQPLTYSIIHNMVHSSEVRQVAFGMYNGNIYHRGGHVTDGWSGTWKQILDENNCKDYVVEEGTSGIWTYRKWNSGIAECWGKHTETKTHYSTAGIFYGYYGSFTYPFVFTELPVFNYNTQVGSGFAMPGSANMSASTSGANWYALATVSGSQTCTINIQVKGKWK